MSTEIQLEKNQGKLQNRTAETQAFNASGMAVYPVLQSVNFEAIIESIPIPDFAAESNDMNSQ